MVEFEPTSSWELYFEVSGNSATGRNVLFSFDSELCSYCSSTGAGCGGEPHFQRWNQDRRDSFHGECDLVLLHKSNFDEHKDLDIHVRTTIEDSWSFVEQAAIKVGDDILEFVNKDDLYLNGVKVDLVVNEEIGFSEDYTIVRKTDGPKTWFVIDLAGRAVIVVRSSGPFYTVTMDGNPTALTGATGLLGKYGTGDMIGRNKEHFFDFMSFSFEWQVNAEDPKLFRTLREPQLPFEKYVIGQTMS
jgi:hypothetical protein